jgi:hypothetical protein
MTVEVTAADEAVACPQNAGLLALQAGGDLTPRQAAQLRRHLDRCPACRLSLAELRSTRDWVRSNLMTPVDAALLTELRRQVVGRLGQERPFPWLVAVLGRAWAGWRSFSWQPVRGVAVAALLLVGALGALPSLNGRLLEHGGFVALPPAADALPALIGPLANDAEELDPAEEASQATGEEGDGLLGLDAGFDDPPSGAGGLRIEMQTRDPNVRIIWFASNTAHGEPPGLER